MLTIKQARERLGMTQEQLAKALGVTQGAVSQWEMGITHPGFESLRKLAAALGVTVDELINGKKEA